MEKEFLNVFRNLELKGELKALLEEVVVTKVSVNRKKDHLRVYIRSRQWIHKKYIYALERAIASQCFQGVSMEVKVLERFALSSQYTPQLFFEAYQSSMGLELKNYSIPEHIINQNAVIFQFQSHRRLIRKITAFWFIICSGMLLLRFRKQILCICFYSPLCWQKVRKKS